VYQLEEQERLGVVNHVHSLFTFVDLEKPAYSSTTFPLYIQKQITSHFNISYPIHIRYQAPTADLDYIKATLEQPQLFMQCNNQWKRVCITDESNVTTHIPTGNLNHESLVTSITMISTLLGSLIIVYFVYNNERTIT